jgi:DNA polymerase IV (family X)
MLSNAEIADRLMSLSQLLSAQKENPFKVKAYRRAAKTIGALSESIDELVRADADLTAYPGIGRAIAGAIREIALSGSLGQLERLRSEASPEVAAIGEYPQLDPTRVLRIFKKLNISSVAALKEKLESGEIREKLGVRMDQHVRRALSSTRQILLYEADTIAASVENFLLTRCAVTRAAATGEYRRRVEVIGELSFVIETADFPAVISKVAQFGGRTELVSSSEGRARFKLSPGIALNLEATNKDQWGLSLIASTGSEKHLAKLQAARPQLNQLAISKARCLTETAVYRKLGLQFIEPELREGRDEVELAAQGQLPALVSLPDIRGELHAHSTSSDGAHTVEQMAAAAIGKGYEYTGITDHSQSLKIARGVSEKDLWAQIRLIDKLNARFKGFRVLKSAEVDILPMARSIIPRHLERARLHRVLDSFALQPRQARANRPHPARHG